MNKTLTAILPPRYDYRPKNKWRTSAPESIAVFLCPIALYGGRGAPSASRAHDPLVVSESATLTCVANLKTSEAYHATNQTDCRNRRQTHVIYPRQIMDCGGAL